MRKRLLFIAFAIICIVSIFINILFTVNCYNIKKTFLSNTYSHLVNISKLLDNTASSVQNGDDIDYNLSSLEKECIQLDDSFYGLSTLSSDNSISYKFQDFNQMISKAIAANDNSSEKIISDLTQDKEKIQELIRELSPGEELSKNEYGDLLITPNYSLSIKQIINLTNDTLENIF